MKSLVKLYTEQMIKEFNAVMEWKEIIAIEPSQEKRDRWVHFAEEEKKHYDHLKLNLPNGDDFSATLLRSLDEEMEKVMECILKHKAQPTVK